MGVCDARLRSVLRVVYENLGEPGYILADRKKGANPVINGTVRAENVGARALHDIRVEGSPERGEGQQGFVLANVLAESPSVCCAASE